MAIQGEEDMAIQDVALQGEEDVAIQGEEHYSYTR